MSDQPEALRLAELLMEWGAEATQLENQAAAELRRLHAELDSLKRRRFSCPICAGAMVEDDVMKEAK